MHVGRRSVRRQGSVEQPTGTLLPQAVGSEGDVGVGGGVQQRCGPHLVVPPRLVRAEAAGVHGHKTVETATGSATSSSLEAIVNVAFTAPRPNIWRPEYVTVERWGSTRYLPAAGTASDGASPTAITASLRLVLPAKLFRTVPLRLIERAGKSSLVQRSPVMPSVQAHCTRRRWFGIFGPGCVRVRTPLRPRSAVSAGVGGVLRLLARSCGFGPLRST